MKRVVVALLVAASVFAALALAETPYVDIEDRLTPEEQHATGIDTLTPEQLELLNRLLRERTATHERRSTPVVPASPATPPATAAAATPAPPPASASAPPAASGRGFPIGLDEGPVATRVVGDVAGWEPGTEFRLANGQVWRVLKGHAKLRKTLHDPEARLVPGLMGRWFLEVDPDLPKARVYRID